jgi:putative heme-binding domain-containing protein
LKGNWLFLLVFLGALPVCSQVPDAGPAGSGAAAGQRLFEARCARCHGLKGTGGTGPGLRRARFRRAADDETFFSLIKEGIPGTEMPDNWTMSDREIKQVVSYVRSLGKAEVKPLPGDPEKGKVVYTKADCSKCHALLGKGGTLGPDLTEVGARRGAVHLRQVLLDPGSAKLVDSFGYLAFLNVQVATHDGRVVNGVRVNEDSFTIQVRDAENRLHSIDKLDVAEMKREPQASIMPTYAKTLSAREIDDLVAFLAGLRGE